MSDNKKMIEDQEEILASTAAENAAETEDSVDLIVKFRRPYHFEGKEYTQVDLSGLEDVSAGALQNVGRALLKKRPGLNPSTIEMTMDYANMLAARVTSLPLEFFERLPGKEGMKIKTAVVGFLYGGDGED